jgi:hypothetical protein
MGVEVEAAAGFGLLSSSLPFGADDANACRRVLAVGDGGGAVVVTVECAARPPPLAAASDPLAVS